MSAARPTGTACLLVDERVATYSVAGSPWRASSGTATSVKSTVPSSNVITTRDVVRARHSGSGAVAHPESYGRFGDASSRESTRWCSTR